MVNSTVLSASRHLYLVNPSVSALPGKTEFPKWVGHIYVLEMSSGLIKVGLSTNPVSRIGDHADQAYVHGVTIKRLWLSQPTLGFRRLERLLISFCSERSTSVSRNEYFKGIRFDIVKDFAESLKFDTPDFAELRRRSAKENSIVSLSDASGFLTALQGIRREDDLGVYWSARDCMKLLAYKRWQDVEDGITRASSTISQALGESALEEHVQAVDVSVRVGFGYRTISDFRLSEFGVYMWVMNCSPAKPEIARAQSVMAYSLAGRG